MFAAVDNKQMIWEARTMYNVNKNELICLAKYNKKFNFFLHIYIYIYAYGANFFKNNTLK